MYSQSIFIWYISVRETDLSSFCRSPSYVTSKKKCIQCPISYCKYCFEYQPNNLLKSTLYKNFEKFDEEEELKVGCALCEDGFIFNFNTGKCINQKPQIQNCIRSFIHQNDQELCTLSEVDDFNIAPEILNCEKYSLYDNFFQFLDRQDLFFLKNMKLCQILNVQPL